MKRRLIEVIKGEKGQVLPAVLILMLIGGLLIAPSLSYASTSLNAGQIVEKKVNGLYAADAGVEYALWYLKNSVSPIPEQLPEEEPVNQMAVAIDTEPKETYTLYRGEIQEVTAQHYDSLAVYGKMEPIGDETYKYTITVTWQEEAEAAKINLEEVGVRLPIGFVYVPDSAADPSFADDNLFIEEPEDTVEQDQAGAYMLNWKYVHEPGKSRPYVSDPDFPGGEGPMPERTQTFYVTGEGGLEGDYTWVGTYHHMDIGIVGEVIGTLYRITATAAQDGEDTATVVADALVKVTEGETETEIRVILWQVNPPEE